MASQKISPDRQPTRKRRKKKAVAAHISAPYEALGVHKPLLACSVKELKQIALSLKIARSGTKKDLITRIEPKLEEKLQRYRAQVKERVAPLAALSGKKLLLIAKRHSVAVEPPTFASVRRGKISAETLFRLGEREHIDLMDKFEMGYNCFRSFIDFVVDVKEGEIVLNVQNINVDVEQQNDLKENEQNANDMQNVMDNLQQVQPGAVLKDTYVRPPVYAPAAASPPPPPPPPPPLVSGATVDDMKDVDKNDPVWVSMLGTAMNTILNIEPREYKATFKNKVARQALVGPLRCVEFNKFAAIKEKEKLNEVIKILVPAGYCKLSKQEPPKSELLSQKNALNDIENLQNDKKAQQNENDEKAKENKNNEKAKENKNNEKAKENKNKNKNKISESEKQVRKGRKGGHVTFFITVNNCAAEYMNRN
eukprot:202218_1